MHCTHKLRYKYKSLAAHPVVGLKGMRIAAAHPENRFLKYLISDPATHILISHFSSHFSQKKKIIITAMMRLSLMNESKLLFKYTRREELQAANRACNNARYNLVEFFLTLLFHQKATYALIYREHTHQLSKQISTRDQSRTHTMHVKKKRKYTRGTYLAIMLSQPINIMLCRS